MAASLRQPGTVGSLGMTAPADPSVEVLATGRAPRLRITPGRAGATHRCEVAAG
ncbi:hypothetical protein ACWCXB_12210 [Streptomyces sp. NPDC001514]